MSSMATLASSTYSFVVNLSGLMTNAKMFYLMNPNLQLWFKLLRDLIFKKLR